MSGEGLHGRATLSVSTDRLAGLTGSSSALDSERSRLVAAPAKTSSTARAKAARDADLSRAVSNLSLESQRSLDVHVHPSTLGRYVRLNVGGSIFLTTLDTLCKQDNMLRAMFTGDLDVQTDKDGENRRVHARSSKRKCTIGLCVHDQFRFLKQTLC